MGLFEKIGKKIFRGMMKSSGVECLNPYIGLILQADDNDLIADEMYRVSLAFQKGAYGLKVDAKKAKEYCQKAASKGHPVAQLFMAMWAMQHREDCNLEVLDWLQKAVDNGERQALYNLGISYHRGDFGKPDINKSYDLIRKSAEKSYGPALGRLALIYYKGEGNIQVNGDLARFFALKGAWENDKMSHEILMMVATDEENKSGRINTESIIEKAIACKEPMAVLEKAMRLPKTDNAIAITLLEEFSESNCGILHECLGVWYYEMEEFEKSIEHLTKAANGGYAWAQYLLADAFYYGKGVPKDVKTALNWVEKSLNFGNKNARALFSEMIMNNDLQQLLPDKVMRGPSYAELAKNENK